MSACVSLPWKVHSSPPYELTSSPVFPSMTSSIQIPALIPLGGALQFVMKVRKDIKKKDTPPVRDEDMFPVVSSSESPTRGGAASQPFS